MVKPRTIASSLKKAIKAFPALVLTGPRQSGKTTLLKEIFGKTHNYFNLEESSIRLQAKDDPGTFLAKLPKPVIIDEIQYVPALLSYIKMMIDEDRRPGQWLLTGSQNFVLMEKTSESLAGRAAIMSLLPFTFLEAIGKGEKAVSVETILRTEPKFATKAKSGGLLLEDVLLRGLYPKIATNRQIERNVWCGSYITTYLERDIRNLQQVGDLSQFEMFLRSCAVRTGQIFDLTDISRETGISLTTVKRWLSLLETGYQVHLLYPYYRNIGKRLVKRPKIYFTDPGLASYLMGIQDAGALFASPYLGALFETVVVNDFWKRQAAFSQLPTLYYLKTRDGLEVDLVVELAGRLHLIEIKSGATITPAHATSLVRANNDLESYVDSARVISNTDSDFSLGSGITNFSWKNLLMS